METILHRIQQIAINEGITLGALERIIGASKGVLSRAIANGTDIQSKWIQIVVENYPQYSSDWLLTGRGEMIREQLPTVTPIYKPKQPEVLGHYSIPLYDVAAAANLQTLFCNREQNILGEISIPNIPKCDGAVYISGDSMYPILKAGDIVAYKEIRDPANIIYGEMYLISLDIEGDDYLTIKYLNRSDVDQCVKLVSYNTYHEPKDIPISSIKALAIVKLSIRKNTM